MIIRVRSRDGIERVEVPNNATVDYLLQAISDQLKIPLNDLRISKDPNLLVSQSPYSFRDLENRKQKLASANVENGSVVFALYPGERQIQPSYRKSKFEERQFGDRMTIEQMVASQVRIERQEKAIVASVSFDHGAANCFQAYVRSALGFSVKRGGLLFGTVDEENNVKVECVYEPPQDSTNFHLFMERGIRQEECANNIAQALGLQLVGWIFAQSSEERDFIVSVEELQQMAAMQAEYGETTITAIVSLDMTENEGHVHFEAYQCSTQCVSLWTKQWFAQEQDENSGIVKMQNPQKPADKTPVIVARQDVNEVDNDFFLCPVNILDHQGPLSCEFPVENRQFPQKRSDLKQLLSSSRSGMSYTKLLADFHVLLYLADKLELSDLMKICESIRSNSPILEGYQFLIDSIAEV
eukprot:g4576.t1